MNPVLCLIFQTPSVQLNPDGRMEEHPDARTSPAKSYVLRCPGSSNQHYVAEGDRWTVIYPDWRVGHHANLSTKEILRLSPSLCKFRCLRSNDLCALRDGKLVLVEEKPTLPYKPTGRDWTEDTAHENGNYQCFCPVCKLPFFGHKRRSTCKPCGTPVQAPAAPTDHFDFMQADFLPSLLPCPFCGEVASADYANPGAPFCGGYYGITCSNEECPVYPSISEKVPAGQEIAAYERLRTRWNSRPATMQQEQQAK